MQAAEAIMSDYSIIQFSLEGGALRARDTARLHAESVAWLRSKLAQSDHARTIVVTHHAPSPRSEAPYHANSPLKPAFASDLDELVEKSHVPLWIHGHTHYNVDYVIGSTRVLTNQRGYPDQLCKDFLRLGVPLVEATRRAMDSVSKFTVSFGSSARNAVDLSCLFLSKSTYWRHQYGERFL